MSGKGKRPDWERRRRDDNEWVPASEWGQAWKHGPHAVIYFVVLTGLLMAGSIFLYRVLGPEAEAARREVYEETKSYRDGTIRDLDNLRLQWLASTDSLHRAALASTALHRAADFPREDLPERVREWLVEIEP